ncbi:MAG: hypothetical protein AUK23_10140 [Deltaproteobacteria bacterium CG2_30_43_15]|nr:MAG: hypothetical protein AUK23_10140 [Deltaproteobacteria bacterium CG2_30_43_15]
MKIDFSKIITDLSGKPIRKDAETDTCLSHVCTEALLSIYQGDEQLPRDEKLKRGKLAEKIYGQSILDVTVAEVAMLQTLIGKAYGPLIVTKTEPMLEGEDGDS